MLLATFTYDHFSVVLSFISLHYPVFHSASSLIIFPGFHG